MNNINNTYQDRINQLQFAAQEIAKKYGNDAVSIFQWPIVEILSEWFHAVRMLGKDASRICQIAWLDMASTELLIMMLDETTTWWRTYSQPHQHADSLTYVLPLTDQWWTYLQWEVTSTLELVEGECIIDWSQPHAFAVKPWGKFLAAIAVSGSGNHMPIVNEDGTYNTTILDVESVTPYQMKLVA